MLEDIVVVQSAISAFNNAALWAPAFLWWAVLAVPLFVMAYLCKDVLLTRIGWTKKNVLDKSAPWLVGLSAAWFILMGGNYAVLRDGATVLPVMTAVILFLSTMFLSARIGCVALPPKKFFWKMVIVASVLVAVVMSDVHTWWGPLLQVGALLIGGVCGRLIGNKFSAISFVGCLMLLVVSAVLMQPEFFRFGQLGNLTVMHLMAVLVFAIFVIGALVVHKVRAAHKIRSSVYAKLKWLLRTFAVLSASFFVLTEALPVFFATVVVMGVLFMVSVRHQREVSSILARQLFALGLFLFGVITVMPVVSVLGILCWGDESMRKFWQNFKTLL